MGVLVDSGYVCTYIVSVEPRPEVSSEPGAVLDLDGSQEGGDLGEGEAPVTQTAQESEEETGPKEREDFDKYSGNLEKTR